MQKLINKNALNRYFTVFFLPNHETKNILMNPLQEAILVTSPISGKLVRRRLGKKLVMAEDARSGAARSAKLAEHGMLTSKATSNLVNRPNWGMHRSHVRG
jgi:hypothetical protein